MNDRLRNATAARAWRVINLAVKQRNKKENFLEKWEFAEILLLTKQTGILPMSAVF